MENEDKLSKPYNPTETEPRIYKKWENSGFFNPDNLPERHKQPYTIMLPPPNATGVLHMGSALMLAIQDILIRSRRMQGYRTLWLPGTDHAAIATQSKVEKEISKKEGKSRHDLGREELLRRISAFVEESRTTIRRQMRVFGASLDWSREAFTLDEKRNFAVNTIFKMMYDDGLIYRKNRIVNWDPKGQTTISDDEIVYEERGAKLYTFKYSHDFPISISTTRPETKVGDTAVAIHPDDQRYQKYIGKEYDCMFAGVAIHIKIVADKEVDPAFGTGALGVTPAHSHADWEIALRHGLPVVQVINEYAKMTVEAPELRGKKTTEARDLIVEWLRSEHLMEKEEDIKQNISTAERTGGIVEPIPKLQWFIDVNKKIPARNDKSLKELMHDAVAENKIKIMPEHFSKTYFHWIENLRDWCISRQIWYGHRIPVWYHESKCVPRQGHEGDVIKCKDMIVSGIMPTCEFCDGSFIQDPDTLDTWFSSGLWTFSALGWPDKTTDLATYHPTDVIETGYDILFFWIARMILMTEYALGDIPFKNIYLHGLVRDAQGRKISKSLGNNIDPIDIANKYGADAGRVALIAGTAPGTDSKISEDKIRGYQHFANKLWNISRFVLGNIDGLSPERIQLADKDTALLKELTDICNKTTDHLENFRLHLAFDEVYQYVWHTFADKILEESKTRLYQDSDEADKTSTKYALLKILKDSLRLLHPFMPFVTEEIWSLVPKETGEQELLMIERWPG